MKRVKVFGLFLSMMLVSTVNTSRAQTRTDGMAKTRINVLFLGGEGSHSPSDRLLWIAADYAKRGINIFYSDRQEDFNLEKLKRFDVLMMYGAHSGLTQAQETALYRYVNEGGGVVAVHAGGGYFKDSDAYISLIGGSFVSHGVGAFTAKTIRPDHPIMKGVSAFESWDESYVHMKHNPDKTVLAVRQEGDREEPWTWVRNQGKGRVFYTAGGHDRRTWNNNAFRKLIENAFRWTAGDWALDADLGPADFTYGTDELMVSRFGEPWNRDAGPENVAKVQYPIPPDVAPGYVIAEPGFRVELFASEPLITKAIDMAWDEKGRLWVLETLDYPNDFFDGRKGHDRIKILEDTDGDHRADKSTIFADGLNMASSLVLYKAGVIVAQAPDVLFLQDTDGDGKADKKEVLFTGWGKSDSHQVANNLQYGFDNYIWGAVGGSGFDGSVGGKPHRFSDGLYRFTPDGSSLEEMSYTSNNTWGLGFNEAGDVFASTANGNPAVHSLIPNRFHDLINKKIGKKTPELPTIANSIRIFPIVERVRQIDYPGGYTAAAGFQVYTARDFPEEYWNRMAFVSEPTGHVLTKMILEPNGSSYTAAMEKNMLASRDEWFAPVQSKVGPDGALWVIDWYNPYITHNSSVVPGGSPTGEGKASQSEIRDKTHGRIYRIVYGKGDSDSGTFNLENASDRMMVSTLQHDNLFWRLTAQRLIVESGNTDFLPLLYPLVQDKSIDEFGLNPGALHAIWAIKGLGALTGADQHTLEVVFNALTHPAASVRRAALAALPRNQQTLDKILALDILPLIEQPGEGTTYTLPSHFRMLSDPKGLMAALLAVAEMPASEQVGEAAAEILAIPAKSGDIGIRTALTAAAVHNPTAFLNRMLQKSMPDEADSVFLADVKETMRVVSANFAIDTEKPAILLDYLERLEKADVTVGMGFLSGISGGWPSARVPSLNDDEKERLKKLGATLPQDYQQDFGKLIQKWQLSDLYR